LPQEPPPRPRSRRSPSVSLQAASKALRRTRPRLIELAAAADRLRVVKLTATCEFCHAPYEPHPEHGGLPQRYCSPACRSDAKKARQRAQHATNHARPRTPPRQDPRPPSFPPAPPWEQGLCSTVPSYQRTWWTSSDRDEREAAARMCQGCPILEPCRAWSMCLPYSDSSIYAGMSAAERSRRKREALAELTRQALKGMRR
jgi:hypothetical protein